MNNQPIGFIDSGVGGLSVVKAVMERLPNEDILFIGDSARNPYGTRSTEEVFKFTKELTNFLQKQNIKALVLACNTATAAALSTLQEELEIPVIGVIEWGSKSATRHSKNKKIGVIATKSTIKSGAYEKEIKSINIELTVLNAISSKFVEMVENNTIENKNTDQIVANELKNFKDTEIDTLILGCTHYPFLKDSIQKYFGEGVSLIDPGIETAQELARVLKNYKLQNEEVNKQKNHIFYTTGDQEKFAKIARNWLPNQKFQVKHVELGE